MVVGGNMSGLVEIRRDHSLDWDTGKVVAGFLDCSCPELCEEEVVEDVVGKRGAGCPR